MTTPPPAARAETDTFDPIFTSKEELEARLTEAQAENARLKQGREPRDISSLQAQIALLSIEELRSFYGNMLLDWSEDDTEVKKIAAKHSISDSDGYGFLGVVQMVERMSEALDAATKARDKALAACGQMRQTVQLCSDYIYASDAQHTRGEAPHMDKVGEVIDSALTSPHGQGWRSPEDWSAMEREVERLKGANEKFSGELANATVALEDATKSNLAALSRATTLEEAHVAESLKRIDAMNALLAMPLVSIPAEEYEALRQLQFYSRHGDGHSQESVLFYLAQIKTLDEAGTSGPKVE